MKIRTGDLVEFKKGLYKDEEGAIYRVLEINGDRTIIELANTTMVIRPQSVAMLKDLDIVQQAIVSLAPGSGAKTLVDG